jgi:hypothetical protein
VRVSHTRDVARVSGVPRESRTIRLEEKWSLSKVNTTSVPKAPSTYVRISFPRATFSTLGREKNYMQIELRNMFRRVRARIFAVCCARLEVNGEQEKKRKRKKNKKKKKKKEKGKGSRDQKAGKGESAGSIPFFSSFFSSFFDFYTTRLFPRSR